MVDRLGLYKVTTGALWAEEDRRKGGMRQLAADRQTRSYRPGGRISSRNVMKASFGAQKAVFKRIRAGGCKTRAQLGNQIDYVNDKADFVFASQANSLRQSAVLTEGQKARILDQWASTWRGTSKLGFTSHMLLSFPEGVSSETVKAIALDWCEEFFESGHYGDEWDYVMAVHTDRAHPHAHILLNNRGKDQGQWFSCWQGGVMSPQLMREKQAEIAERYGIALDATSRIERGLFMKPAGLDEIYAAKAQGRAVSEIAMTPEEKAIAQAAMVEFRKEYRDLSDFLRKQEQRVIANAVERMANTLGTGTTEIEQEGDIPLEQIRTVGDAIDFAETNFAEIRAEAAAMDPAARAEFETRAAPVIGQLSLLMPDPELRTAYNSELVSTYPPGAEGAAFKDALSDEEQGEVLEYGRSIGLDVDETMARMEAGGTKNYGLADEWLDRDVSAILTHAGIGPAEATEEQRLAAMDRLDAFQDQLAGLSAESGLGREADDGDTMLTDDKSPNVYLAMLAEKLNNNSLSDADEASIERSLQTQLHNEIGDEGMVALADGDYSVLEDVLPNKADRILVTREYVELKQDLVEDDPAGDALIHRLTNDLKAEQQAEARMERRRDRDLDDDMGL